MFIVWGSNEKHIGAQPAEAFRIPTKALRNNADIQKVIPSKSVKSRKGSKTGVSIPALIKKYTIPKNYRSIAETDVSKLLHDTKNLIKAFPLKSILEQTNTHAGQVIDFERL